MLWNSPKVELKRSKETPGHDGTWIRPSVTFRSKMTFGKKRSSDVRHLEVIPTDPNNDPHRCGEKEFFFVVLLKVQEVQPPSVGR